MGGDLPTERPKHDFTCTDASEVIRFTPAFGAAIEPGAGAEAVLDPSGLVTAFHEARGGAIPADGSVLSGTGEGAEWLRGHARVGMRIAVSQRITEAGDPYVLGGEADVVNGGPRLVDDDEVKVTAYKEGFHWPENPEFYYRFGVHRNPRTLAGITGRGKFLLVAVDGRRPGYSVGASFRESAKLMEALGAEEAVNLDGGGSATITLGSQVQNRPSDVTGERPIGDAIVILP